MKIQEKIRELIWKHFGPAPDYAIYEMDDCIMCGRPLRPCTRVEGYIDGLTKDIVMLIKEAYAAGYDARRSEV